MVYLQKISLPTTKNLKYLNNFSDNKITNILSALQFIHPSPRYNKNFWQSVILFGLLILMIFLVLIKYLDKNIKTKKTYIIYDINFKDFTNNDSALLYDTEKYVFWFIGEYIKFKKLNYKIQNYKNQNSKQLKFDSFKKKKIWQHFIS